MMRAGPFYYSESDATNTSTRSSTVAASRDEVQADFGEALANQNLAGSRLPDGGSLAEDLQRHAMFGNCLVERPRAMAEILPTPHIVQTGTIGKPANLPCDVRLLCSAF